MSITEYIPAKVRKPLYAILATAFLVIGALQVGFAAVDAGVPGWLTVALAIVPFVASAVGFTAQGNTKPVGGTTVDPDDVESVDEDDEDDEPLFDDDEDEADDVDDEGDEEEPVDNVVVGETDAPEASGRH